MCFSLWLVHLFFISPVNVVFLLVFVFVSFDLVEFLFVSLWSKLFLLSVEDVCFVLFGACALTPFLAYDCVSP